MSATLVLWFAAGLTIGGHHAWMLWRMSQPPFHAAAWHLPRFLTVGAFLLASALGGELLPALLGWITGYVLLVGIIGVKPTS